MAANKGVVHCSATVLPDNLKKHVSGVASYDLNDIGGNDRWVHYINSLAANTSEIIIPAGVSYMASDAGDVGALVTVTGSDKVSFLVLKHTGYQADGVTKTAANTAVYFNIESGQAAANAADNMVLYPGEVWWCRLTNNNEIDDCTLYTPTGTANIEVYACVDDAS